MCTMSGVRTHSFATQPVRQDTSKVASRVVCRAGTTELQLGVHDPGAFKLDHLESTVWNQVSMQNTLLLGHRLQCHLRAGCRRLHQRRQLMPGVCPLGIQIKRAHCNGPKSEWQLGVDDPGAFQLDHLESLKPIFAKFFPPLLRVTCTISLFLHPWKRAHCNGPQKRMTTRGGWP